MDLSIIIPVYNCEKYLEECIDSLMEAKNSGFDYEIIIIDDGSTDNTPRMCDSLQDEAIKVIHQENSGVSFSRNRGINEASGRYIMFVDADDVLVRGWSKIVSRYVSSSFDIVYFLKNAKKTSYSNEEFLDSLFGVSGAADLAYITAPWSKLFSRDLIINNNICFDKNLINGEDSVFNLKAYFASESQCFSSDSIYKYRIFDGSSTKKYSPLFYKSNLFYLEEAERILKSEGNLDDKKIKFYIGHSFEYSVYLYTFLISQIKDPAKRLEPKQLMHSQEMEKFFSQTQSICSNKAVVRVIYKLQKRNLKVLPYAMMNAINVVRRTTKGEVKWIEI